MRMAINYFEATDPIAEFPYTTNDKTTKRRILYERQDPELFKKTNHLWSVLATFQNIWMIKHPKQA